MSNAKEPRKRLEITDTTKRELYFYSGNRCAFVPCPGLLLLEDGTLNGRIAHIHGVQETAARGTHSLSNEQLREPRNLLLLCNNHHDVVDNKKNEDKWTVEVLQDMKTNHEAKYRRAALGLGRISDASLEDSPQYPANIFAIKELQGFPDDSVQIVDSLATAKRFIDDFAKQPLGIRDLAALILLHGEERRDLSTSVPAPVMALLTQVRGVAQLDMDDLDTRIKHLEDAGFLQFVNYEGTDLLSLRDPSQPSNDFNLFNYIFDIAEKDRSVIERAILNLDFTILEGPAE